MSLDRLNPVLDVMRGLCGRCRHSKEIRNDRGSVFTLCLRSFREPEYPKYPRLPVLKCAGFEEKTPTENQPLEYPE